MSTDSTRPEPDPKIDSIVSKKVNEVTEMDLWDMDFIQENIPAPPESAPRTPGQLPSQRKTASKIRTKKPTELKPKTHEIEEDPKPEAEADETAPIEQISSKTEEPEPPSDTREELSVPEDSEAPAGESDLESEDDIFADLPDTGDEIPVPEWEETAESPETEAEQKPAPVIPPIGSLTKIEKIAISALCAALALGATLTLIHFSSHVPTRPLITEEIDFPVSGKIIEITGAATYWRKPVTEGENPDVVRRDTKLIPVLLLNISSKSGAIRVFFRNDEGAVVGDGITRTVKGETDITVAATAGFEDVGMHTAYRTKDTKPWVVQVFEGPDATAPREKFRKVLETEISTQIR